MSQTQIAFLKRAEMPTKKQIEERIRQLNFDFNILNDLEKPIDNDGIECIISGQKTYIETFVDNSNEILIDAEWIRQDVTTQDTAISFIWGADFAAGACISLISIALIDHSEAIIYYMDDQMKYSREMLMTDVPLFLDELKKQTHRTPTTHEFSKSTQPQIQNKKSFWDKIKDLFK